MSSAHPNVVAIVPAHNEAERIAETLEALARTPEVARTVVVDDGSEDDTAAVAEGAGAEVVRLPHNQGKGAALEAGLQRADGDIVLLLDADLGPTANQAGKLLSAILADEADLAIARFPEGRKRSGFGLAQGLSRRGIRWLCGCDPRWPMSGQRAMRHEVIAALRPLAPGFGVETAMTIDAVRAGFRVVEVACNFEHRRTGRNWAGFRHRGRQFLDVLRAIVSRW
ncbi:MAG: glycosyltransferase family 2 protein, partial [Armatimonadota bacterium]